MFDTRFIDEEFIKTFDKYEEKFGEAFPTMIYDKDIPTTTKMMKKCIKKNKPYNINWSGWDLDNSDIDYE